MEYIPINQILVTRTKLEPVAAEKSLLATLSESNNKKLPASWVSLFWSDLCWSHLVK